MVKKETKKEYAETHAEITERLAQTRNAISIKNYSDQHVGEGKNGK